MIHDTPAGMSWLTSSVIAITTTPGSAFSGIYGPAVAYIRRWAAERH